MKRSLIQLLPFIFLLLLTCPAFSEESKEEQVNAKEDVSDVEKEWEVFQKKLKVFLDETKFPEDLIPCKPNTSQEKREIDEYFSDQWKIANRNIESSAYDAQEEFVVFREKVSDLFASVLANNGIGNYKNHVRSYLADQLTLWYIDFMKEHLLIDHEKRWKQEV